MTKFDQPLWVELEASRLLLVVAVTLYSVAAVAWWCAPAPPAIRFAAGAVLLLHFIHLYRVHIANTSIATVQALSWHPTRGWRLRGGDGRWFAARLLSPVFVSHRLVAVRFRTGRFRTRGVVLVADRLAADDFRRLRVRLLQSTHDD